MWVLAMFDLPVDSKDARRQYTQFRKALLRQGFMMMQFSVYIRYVRSEETEQAHRRAIRAVLPSDGQVRLLSVTDRQFGKMDVFVGKKRKSAEKPPEQMLLF